MRELKWTQRALRRLDEIADYIAADNPARATSFVRELRTKIEILREHSPGTPGRVFGTKELVLHENYIAVYRVVNGAVQIITLLHAAQRR